MDKSNIIISIIIVICIAAGVAAYGITNSENPVFSNLNSVDSGSGDSGNGIGNNTTHHDSQSTNSHGSGNGGTGTGSGSGVSSGSGSGSSSSSGSGSGSGSGRGHHPTPSPTPSTPKITSGEAKSIANQNIEAVGWYAGTPTLSADKTVWYVPIFDQNGATVDSIEINANTGAVIGRG
ncbi:PepSY domain-containing protein [Methanobrevibacter sp. TLL-48-HuF1]|uniref:PepSY domain-containing protein n=1 Tax=Methanobrevibacter TaxID=2172 RepID=UPI00036FD6F6|nr:MULTISPECIES: PepSY domain-containing protein [Methanobrevibacter]URN48818.1 PepSY domain-containing protein [Methanobrevibacter sp. TLL-48-HuF1]